MKKFKVLVEAIVEVEDKNQLDDVMLCYAEYDEYSGDNIPLLKSNHFNVVDYITFDTQLISEVEDDNE